MNWQDILKLLSEFVHDHWLKAVSTVILMIGSSLLAYFWAWRSWRRRQDMEVIHYSQNTIETRPTGPDGKPERWLVLDVHSENPLEVEVSHPIPRKLIQKAASATTEDQPFLLFSKDDRWYILNLIRLAIAEPFKFGTAAKLVEGARVAVVNCIFAITYERYPGIRQGKIRVMIVRQQDLDNPAAFQDDLRLESPVHKHRITTLKKMQADYAKGEANWQYCLNVRLNIQL